VPDWPASIAAVGLALAAYPVAVERGFIARAEAVERVLTTLRFFWTSPHRISARGCGEQGSAGGGYEDTKTCHSRSRRGTGGAELGPARPALTRAETPLT